MRDTDCKDCGGELFYTVEVVDIFQDQPEYRQVECDPCMTRLSDETWAAVQAELHTPPVPVVDSTEHVAARRESFAQANRDITSASDWDAAVFAGLILVVMLVAFAVMSR